MWIGGLTEHEWERLEILMGEETAHKLQRLQLRLPRSATQPPKPPIRFRYRAWLEYGRKGRRTHKRPENPAPRVIYALIDPRTKEVRYVGQTLDAHARAKAHSHPSFPTTADWVIELREAGLKPLFVELEHCPAEKRNARERYWIGYYLTRSDLLNRNLSGVTIGQEEDLDVVTVAA